MSVNPGSFGDLGKEAKEALFKSKDFNTKDQVSLTTTSSNGVKAISKLTREDGGKIAAQLEFKFPKHSVTGLEASATFDNKGKTKASVASADKLAPGLKTTVAAEFVAAAEEKDRKRDLSFTAEYKREHLFTNTKFTVPFNNAGAVIAASSVVSSTVVGLESQGVSVGVEIDYSLGEASLRGLHAVGQYKAKNFTLLGFSRQTFGTKPAHVCGAIYHMRVPTSVLANTEVVGELEYDTLKPSDNTTLAVGAGFDVNENTRLNVKGDSRGRSTLILTHQLNKNLRLRLGGDVSNEQFQLTKSFVELAFTD
jgi:hypothetical protein